jgi:hypothetical protein
MTRTTSVPTQRLLRGIAASVTATITDAAGDPAAGLTVTVTIARADGTSLYTDTATTGNGDGTYSKALTATELANLDVLTCTWKVSTVARATTVHEIQGGYYFTAGDLAIAEQGRAGSIDADTLIVLRDEVETEVERICGAAFVPRYRRVRLDGTGTTRLLAPDPLPRTVRSVRVYSDATTYTSFTAAEVAALELHDHGLIERRDHNVFPAGAQNILVEYEHGHDRPPADLRRAVLRRARSRALMATSGIPDRALSFTAENGQTFRLATPDAWSTGDPEVDAVYDRHAVRAARLGIA